jgi:hypothetical protein
MSAMPVKTPLEKIVRMDVIAAIINAKRDIADMKFVVILACGHRAYVRAQHRAMCQRCREMLRRSLEDGSEDYIGFREGLVQDNMEWEKDPCRPYNERLNGDSYYDIFPDSKVEKS